MNWLVPLQQQIQARRSFPQAQRDACDQWACELAAICDQWVKAAPAPILDSIDQFELLLRWQDEHDERELTLYIEPEEMRASLHLRHLANSLVTPSPTHERLKSAVRSFFNV